MKKGGKHGQSMAMVMLGEVDVSSGNLTRGKVMMNKKELRNL